MNMAIHRAWDEFLGPLLQRPKQLQVAALCHRGTGENRRYLLVTSRDTKRWIIPKGWPVRGLKSHEAALREAWEEAGVRHTEVSAEPIGTYIYQKRQSSGWSFPVQTLVYDVAVRELSDNYPESEERTRKWFTAEAAANLVEEGELQSIFREQQWLTA